VISFGSVGNSGIKSAKTGGTLPKFQSNASSGSDVAGQGFADWNEKDPAPRVHSLWTGVVEVPKTSQDKM